MNCGEWLFRTVGAGIDTRAVLGLGELAVPDSVLAAAGPRAGARWLCRVLMSPVAATPETSPSRLRGWVYELALEERLVPRVGRAASWATSR